MNSGVTKLRNTIRLISWATHLTCLPLLGTSRHYVGCFHKPLPLDKPQHTCDLFRHHHTVSLCQTTRCNLTRLVSFHIFSSYWYKNRWHDLLP